MASHLGLISAILLLAAAAGVAAEYPNFISIHPLSDVSLAVRHCNYSLYASTAKAGTSDLIWQALPGLTGSEGTVSFRPISSFGRYLCAVSSDVSATGLMLVADPQDVSSCTFEDLAGLSDSSYHSYKLGDRYLTLSGDVEGPCTGFSNSLVLGTPAQASMATWYINNASTVKLWNHRLSTIALRHCYFEGYASPDDSSSDMKWNVIPAVANSTGLERVTLQPAGYAMLYGGTFTPPYRFGATDCFAALEDCVFELREAFDGAEGYVSLVHLASGRYLALNTTVGMCTWLGTGTADAILSEVSSFAVVGNSSASWLPTYVGAFPNAEDFLPEESEASDSIGDVTIVSDSIFVSLHPYSNLSLGLHSCSRTPYVSAPASVNHPWLWQMTSALTGDSLPYISLRMVDNLEQYLCVVPTSESVTGLAVKVPSNKSTCVFKKVTGLARTDSAFIGLMFEDKYLSFSNSIEGPCSTSLSSAYSLTLMASPASASATWYLNDVSKITLASDNTSNILRNCYYRAYAAPYRSSDDYRWNVVSPFDSSMGANAVSLQSPSYPTLYLGLYTSAEPTRLAAVSYCATEPAKCTFLLKSPKDGKAGSISLYHPYTGKYVSIDMAATGECSAAWASVQNVVVGSSARPHSKNSWTVKFDGSWPGKNTISVPSATIYHNISSNLYGAFFEEINFAGEGGLYAELIRNRDFEALGRGLLGDFNGTSAANTSNYHPWKFTTVSGSASASLQNQTQPFATNPHALEISAQSASSVTLVNPGFWGINTVAAKSYTGSFYAKTTGEVAITLHLAHDGETVSTIYSLSVSGNTWSKYSFTLTGTASTGSASLVISAQIPANGGIFFDSISLFPGDAVKGLFRKDLFDLLNQIKPAFLRFPGGNYLEGYTIENRWNWKHTIGEAASRAGHYNDAWGYWSTDGFGLYEFHVLCEALGSKPLMSIFTGYTLAGTYVNINQSAVFAQDALDAIEYANGNVNTTYGKLRAEAGHPASFSLDMVEVGNEEALPAEYATHYTLITDAIWTAYPDIEIIASGRWGASMTGHPCTNGARCDIWDDHYYLSPSVMYSYNVLYDSYDRSTLPKVFVGEYAANANGALQNAQAAIAEATFMIGFERNADVVVMASFAPLLNNVKGTQWSYDLINFNSSSYYVLPSFYVQKLFRQEQCIHTVNSTVSGSLIAVSCVKADGSLVIKAVNWNSPLINVKFDLSGFDHEPNATLTLLTGGLAVNTMEDPFNVVPVTSTIQLSDDLWIEQYTLIVVRIAMKKTKSTPNCSSYVNHDWCASMGCTWSNGACSGVVSENTGSCGNGVMESGEQCDSVFWCDSSCQCMNGSVSHSYNNMCTCPSLNTPSATEFIDPPTMETTVSEADSSLRVTVKLPQTSPARTGARAVFVDAASKAETGVVANGFEEYPCFLYSDTTYTLATLFGHGSPYVEEKEGRYEATFNVRVQWSETVMFGSGKKNTTVVRASSSILTFKLSVARTVELSTALGTLDGTMAWAYLSRGSVTLVPGSAVAHVDLELLTSVTEEGFVVAGLVPSSVSGSVVNVSTPVETTPSGTASGVQTWSVRATLGSGSVCGTTEADGFGLEYTLKSSSGAEGSPTISGTFTASLKGVERWCASTQNVTLSGSQTTHTSETAAGQALQFFVGDTVHVRETVSTDVGLASVAVSKVTVSGAALKSGATGAVHGDGASNYGYVVEACPDESSAKTVCYSFELTEGAFDADKGLSISTTVTVTLPSKKRGVTSMEKSVVEMKSVIAVGGAKARSGGALVVPALAGLVTAFAMAI